MAINSIEAGIQQEFGGDFKSAPVILRVTGTSNGLPTVLSNGVTYRMVSTVDCYIRQTDGAMTVATSNATPIFAGVVYRLPVGISGDSNIVGITAGGTGDVYLTKPRG